MSLHKMKKQKQNKKKYCKHVWHRYEDYTWRSKSYFGKDIIFRIEECGECFKLKFKIVRKV